MPDKISIAKLKLMKEELMSEIASLIHKFEKTTGTEVHRLGISRVHLMDGTAPFQNLELEVKL